MDSSRIPGEEELQLRTGYNKQDIGWTLNGSKGWKLLFLFDFGSLKSDPANDGRYPASLPPINLTNTNFLSGFSKGTHFGGVPS